MRRNMVWILAVALLLLTACGGSGVSVVEEKGATADNVTYVDGVVSGSVTFDTDRTQVRYAVDAQDEKNGSLQTDQDAFSEVRAGESYDFSFNLYDQPYQGNIHYGGSKGLGELSREILGKGEVYFSFTDPDGGTLLKLRLH